MLIHLGRTQRHEEKDEERYDIIAPDASATISNTAWLLYTLLRNISNLQEFAAVVLLSPLYLSLSSEESCRERRLSWKVNRDWIREQHWSIWCCVLPACEISRDDFKCKNSFTHNRRHRHPVDKCAEYVDRASHVFVSKSLISKRRSITSRYY